jgi:hypothetical protein
MSTHLHDDDPHDPPEAATLRPIPRNYGGPILFRYFADYPNEPCANCGALFQRRRIWRHDLGCAIWADPSGVKYATESGAWLCIECIAVLDPLRCAMDLMARADELIEWFVASRSKTDPHHDK